MIPQKTRKSKKKSKERTSSRGKRAARVYDTTSSKEALCGTDTLAEDDSSSIQTQSITDFNIFNAVSYNARSSNKYKAKNRLKETSDEDLFCYNDNAERDIKRKNRIKCEVNVTNRHKQDVNLSVMHHGKHNPVPMDTKRQEVEIKNVKDLMLDRGYQTRGVPTSRRSPASLSDEWDINNLVMNTPGLA